MFIISIILKMPHHMGNSDRDSVKAAFSKIIWRRKSVKISLLSEQARTLLLSVYHMPYGRILSQSCLNQVDT